MENGGASGARKRRAAARRECESGIGDPTSSAHRSASDKKRRRRCFHCRRHSNREFAGVSTFLISVMLIPVKRAPVDERLVLELEAASSPLSPPRLGISSSGSGSDPKRKIHRPWHRSHRRCRMSPWNFDIFSSSPRFPCPSRSSDGK